MSKCSISCYVCVDVNNETLRILLDYLILKKLFTVFASSLDNKQNNQQDEFPFLFTQLVCKIDDDPVWHPRLESFINCARSLVIHYLLE